MDVAPNGFLCIHAPRVGRKKATGGGVAIVYRENIRVELIQPSVRTRTFESLCVKAVFGSRRVTILAVYRPPPRANADFFTEISTLWDNLNALPGELLICGDFNCGGIDTKSIDVRLSEIIDDCGYRQYVTTPTRNQNGVENLLDVVIAHPDANIIEKTSVIEIAFSDHRLVVFDTNLPSFKASCTTYVYRDLKHIDLGVFEDEIRNSNIFSDPPEPVDEYVSQLNDIVVLALDKLAPLKSKTKRESIRSTTLWMSVEAKEAKRKRRRLERKYRKTSAESDYVAYRKASRESVKMIKNARAGYFKQAVSEAQGDQRAMWRTAKQLLHSTPEKSLLTPAESIALANSFTTFFSDKLLKIKTSIVQSLSMFQKSPQSHPAATPYPMVVLTPVTFIEALKLVKSHSTSKSSPIDIIPSYLVRSCPNLFAELLTEISNRSFRQGKFPSSYKTAQITPLLKKPSLDPSLPSSFRPISNLTTFSKLLERLVQSRLRPHIIASPNYSHFQSAYRPLHSTETAMLRVTNDLLTSVGSGSAVFLVTLDLTAAFDTVNHTKLLERLKEEFGVSREALEWISSYLCDRRQYVKVGSSTATTTECFAGVPQGSVLGPLLFAAYVAPVSRVINAHGVHQHSYADDITLYLGIGTDFQNSDMVVLNCADDVGQWFLQNDLLLNESKSEVIVIGTSSQLRKSDRKSSYLVGAATIAPVDSVKIVGVTLDNHLSFDKHISTICSACALHTRALRHIRPLLDLKTANAIACSSIGTRLDYCNSLLAGISAHNISRLQRIQNSAAKTVCSAARLDSPIDSLRQLHWLPVQQRIDYKVAVLTFNALSTGSPEYIRELISPYEPTRELRSSGANQLVIPTSNNTTTFACRAFQNYAPKLWNNLPTNLRDLVTPVPIIQSSDDLLSQDETLILLDPLKRFKCQLKTTLFNTAYN